MRKYALSAIGFLVVILLTSPVVHAQTTTATSTTDTQSIIQLLQEQVKTLLAQVKELQAKLESTSHK